MGGDLCSEAFGSKVAGESAPVPDRWRARLNQGTDPGKRLATNHGQSIDR